MISTLKKLERFLESEELMQTDDDPRIQLFIQWYETYDTGHLSTVPMSQKETQLIFFARKILTEPQYQLVMTTGLAIKTFLGAAMELVRIIAAPLPKKRMNRIQMQKNIQDGTLPKSCAYEDCYEYKIQKEGDQYSRWILFTGDSEQGDKAVVVAAYWGGAHVSTSIFCSIVLTGPTGHIDSQFLRMVSNDADKPDALYLPSFISVFRRVARLFEKIGGHRDPGVMGREQEDEIGTMYRDCLNQSMWIYWLGKYCNAMFSPDGSKPFCFVAEPTQARAKRIRVKIELYKVIVEQIR